MARLRLVVLASGRGSNLESLLRASRAGTMAADVVLVVASRPDAPALDVSHAAGVPTFVSPAKGRDQAAHEAEMRPAIDAAKPDLVCLAGYMRILTPAFLRAYEGRLVNIHPALLPAFPGLDAAGQAARAGVRVAGCTTHFVTEEVDGGPILMQAAVAIPPGASAEDVASRILAAEHKLYPATVHALATGAARLSGGRVVWRDGKAPEAWILSPEVA